MEVYIRVVRIRRCLFVPVSVIRTINSFVKALSIWIRELSRRIFILTWVTTSAVQVVVHIDPVLWDLDQ